MSKTFCKFGTFVADIDTTSASNNVEFFNFDSSGVVTSGVVAILIPVLPMSTVASLKTVFQSAWQDEFHVPGNQFVWLDDKGLL